MKVVFAGQQICSGVGKDSPVGYKRTGTREVQKSKPLRAPAGVCRDRANRLTDVAFQVVRDHGTIQKAEQFCNTHQDSLPGSGLLTLIGDDGSHTSTFTSYIANAVLSSVECLFKGQLSWTNYKWEGGNIVTKPPTGS